MTSPLAVLAAADPSLITVGGLPLHPLAVHAVVVLLPLAIVGLIAIIVKPSWRSHYIWPVMGALVLGTGATLVAVQAGENLALVTGISEEHRKLGKLLGYDAIALLFFATVWALSQRGSGASKEKSGLGNVVTPLSALGSIALGLVALGLSALVGHSGANAVWESKIAAAPTPTASSTASATSYTAADVKTHASSSDCWSIIDNNAYNLTDWINKHPGGPGVIQSLCGVDGSAAFAAQHSGSQRAADFLASYKVGAVSGGTTPTTPAKPINELTLAGVQTHNTAAACWSIVNGNIYNLTSWISRHPGGAGVIQGMCGIDATAAFTGQHGNQGEPNQTLSSFLLGPVKG